MSILVKGITWFGRPAVIACDGRCGKAWGINGRPRVQVSGDDPDDYAFLADGELGEAPRDPGTYEGECGKPADYSDPDRQNKWCSRECERGEVIQPGGEFTPRDFSRRHYNIPSHDPGGEGPAETDRAAERARLMASLPPEPESIRQLQADRARSPIPPDSL